MLGIIYYIFIVVGLLEVLTFSFILFDLLALGGGIGSTMALVAISRVFKPLIILSVAVITGLLFFAYFTDRFVEPYRFWFSVIIPLLIFVLGFGIFLVL